MTILNKVSILYSKSFNKKMTRDVSIFTAKVWIDFGWCARLTISLSIQLVVEEVLLLLFVIYYEYISSIHLKHKRLFWDVDRRFVLCICEPLNNSWTTMVGWQGSISNGWSANVLQRPRFSGRIRKNITYTLSHLVPVLCLLYTLLQVILIGLYIYYRMFMMDMHARCLCFLEAFWNMWWVLY